MKCVAMNEHSVISNTNICNVCLIIQVPFNCYGHVNPVLEI